MQRRNLQVVTEALCERILFEGRRPVGIAFRRFGRVFAARAARAIILCGGAVNSPQLLMLSGIGPQEHLAAFGIPVVQQLPGVGQCLQDHYLAPFKLKCRVPITVNDVMLSSAKKLRAGFDYYLLRKGPLAMHLACGVIRAHPAGAGVPGCQTVDPAIQRRPTAGRATSVVGLLADRLSATPR